MKTWIVLVMSLLSGWTASAQWVWTPEVGANVTKDNGSERAKMGFKAGMGVTYEFTPSFGIKSGLFMVRRSGAWQQSWTQWAYRDEGYVTVTSYRNTGKEHKYYFQIPLMAQRTWQVCGDVKLTAGVGPYIAVGVAGKTKGQLSTVSSGQFPLKETDAFAWESPIGGLDARYDDAQYNPFKDHGRGSSRVEGDPRFDWGGTAAVGISVRRIAFQVGYDLNMGKGWHGQNDVRIRSHTVSFTLGYTL